MLDDLHMVFFHLADDGHVSTFPLGVDQQVSGFWCFAALIAILDQSAAGVYLAMPDLRIKIAFGIPPYIRHVMLESVMIIAFHKFDTLPALTKIIALVSGEMLSVAGVTIIAVGVNGNPMLAIDNRTYRWDRQI